MSAATPSVAPARTACWSEETRGRFLDPDSAARGRLAPLTVFTFLWAAQALVHQEFYQVWMTAPMLAGWAVTLLGLAVLVRPGSIPLFATLLAASVVYNVARWPWVSNHILVESLMNMTILGALALSVREQRRGEASIDLDDRALAASFWERFAPVLMSMTIVMYAFAFVAKLNTDFFDVSVSCTSVMFVDMLRRFPFLPDTEWARSAAIWSTVGIEATLPLLLAFRRTRPLALLVGLPFHLILGLIGHRTFSALIFALYFLFLPYETCHVLAVWRARLDRALGVPRRRRLLKMVTIATVLGTATLVALGVAGLNRWGVGAVKMYRVPWALWIVAAVGVSAVYFEAVLRSLRGRGPRRFLAGARPGLLWLAAGVVVFNGMTQYLGLKTELAFTMYSNLRTEGARTNHLFVPSSWKMFGYQEDLVRILTTDDPVLQGHAQRDELLTWFELRRFTSGAGHDFHVTYERAGEEFAYAKRDGAGTDPELDRPHPLWMAKLLSFRPVSAGDCMECMH